MTKITIDLPVSLQALFKSLAEDYPNVLRERVITALQTEKSESGKDILTSTDRALLHKIADQLSKVGSAVSTPDSKLLSIIFSTSEPKEEVAEASDPAHAFSIHGSFAVLAQSGGGYVIQQHIGEHVWTKAFSFYQDVIDFLRRAV